MSNISHIVYDIVKNISHGYFTLLVFISSVAASSRSRRTWGNGGWATHILFV